MNEYITPTPKVGPAKEPSVGMDPPHDRGLCAICQTHNCHNCWNNPNNQLKQTITATEALRADLRLAHEAMLMHASSVADSRAGVLRMTRYRARLSAPSKNYVADHIGEWNCSIAEDAPIWEPRREGTRTWRVGEEVRDE